MVAHPGASACSLTLEMLWSISGDVIVYVPHLNKTSRSEAAEIAELIGPAALIAPVLSALSGGPVTSMARFGAGTGETCVSETDAPTKSGNIILNSSNIKILNLTSQSKD